MSKTLIPNTFQHPNAYIDWLSYYLTGEEEKVLNKAVREILGWYDKIASRRARISLSIFYGGKTIKNEQVCMGCGLSMDAIRAALASLHEFNILIKVGKPTKDGQEYELVESWDDLAWDKIKERRDQWDSVNRKRTAAAREILEESRKVEPTVGQNSGLLSDSRQGVLSDSNKETQVETQVELAASPPNVPSKKPFSPLPMEFNIQYYYKDKQNVSAQFGNTEKGPWVAHCPHCKDKTVAIIDLDTPTECLCGMHKFVLTKNRPKVEVERQNEAVEAYLLITGRKRHTIAQEWLDEIAITVTDVPFWRRVVKEWCGLGWNRGNISKMLDYYKERKIPGTRQKLTPEGAKPRETIVDGKKVLVYEDEKRKNAPREEMVNGRRVLHYDG